MPFIRGRDMSNIGTIKLGGAEFSRLIVGGNPFSGVSHQNPRTDLAMKRYFTSARIMETLRTAESCGITTFIGRADRHITRLLFEYRNAGGTLKWIAPTCPEISSQARSVGHAIA